MRKILVAAVFVSVVAGWAQAQPADRDPPTTDLNLPANPALNNWGFQSTWAQLEDAISQFKKPNLRWGLLALHPYFGAGGSYDSNIYLQPQSHVRGQTANGGKAGPVRGSWITDTNFGLKASLPLAERHQLSADYDFIWHDYVKDPRINNSINQTLNASYAYEGTQGLSGRVKENYLNTSDPATTELVERQQRWENTVSAQAEYRPKGGHLFAAIDGSDIMDKYISNAGSIRTLMDHFTELVGVKTGWRFSPATRIYASYHRQLIHYTVHQPDPRDSRSNFVDGGVEGRIAPKLTGVIQSGAQFRAYDTASAVYTGAAKNTATWMVSTALTYTPLERTSIDLLLSRNLQESTFFPSQYYVANNVGLSFKHKFPTKLTATLNMGMELDQYPGVTPASGQGSIGGATGKRRDDVYQIGPGLSYDIQEWLRASAGYLYRTRFSVFSEQFNYADQITTVGLKVLF